MPNKISRDALTQKLIEALGPLSWEKRLAALRDFSDFTITFSTSYSLEDQIITHGLAQHMSSVKVFTLDTGRLFEETYDTAQATHDRYPNLSIETYYPDANAAQVLVASQGINGFRESIENRKNCCFVRKVEPLNRALEGADIWISGLRHDHSENRRDLPVAEFDTTRNIVKLYPIIDIDEAELRTYIERNDIPYNPLHDRGYPSIGCAPCTRAVQPGEHPRAGRWWWEQDSAQECGLHMVDGKLVRKTHKPLAAQEKRTIKTRM